jgi:hypothetical protein
VLRDVVEALRGVSAEPLNLKELGDCGAIQPLVTLLFEHDNERSDPVALQSALSAVKNLAADTAHGHR